MTVFYFSFNLITRTASSSQTTSRLELDSMMGDSKASRQPIFNSSGLILLITSLANLFPTSGALWSTYFWNLLIPRRVSWHHRRMLSISFHFISFGFLPYIALMRHYFIGPSFARLKITNCLTPRAWQHRSSLFGLAFYRCNRFCNHFENCRNRLASIWTCIKVGFLYYWRWDSQCQQEPPRDQQPNINQHLASRPSGSSTPTERSSLNGDSLQKFQSADLAEINYLVTYCQKLPHIESSTASRAFSPIQSHTLSLHEAVWMGVLTQNTPHISNEGSDLTHSCATAGGTQRFIAALH